jgi:hypothetical protein
MTWQLHTPDGKPWTCWDPPSLIHTAPLRFSSKEDALACWREHPIPAVLVHESGLREEVNP